MANQHLALSLVRVVWMSVVDDQGHARETPSPDCESFPNTPERELMIFIHPYAGTLAVRLLIAAALAVSVSSIPAGMIFHDRIASMNFPIDDEILLAPREHTGTHTFWAVVEREGGGMTDAMPGKPMVPDTGHPMQGTQCGGRGMRTRTGTTRFRMG